jgi:fatty-acyl-CoA synthase
MPSPWTLTTQFDARVREHPDRPVVQGIDRTWSYRQVELQAVALAAAFADLGIERGDRVAVNLPNGVEWLVTVLACARLGVPVVPISPQLNVHELRYQLRHAEASLVVTIERFANVDFLQRFEEVMADLPDLQYVVTVGEEDLWYDDRIFQFEDLLSKGQGRPVPPVEVSDDDDLAVIYTSGSAGKPKGVRLSHAALLGNAVRAGQLLELAPEDRVLSAVPFFTVFGFAGLLGTILAGATQSVPARHDAATVLAALEAHRVTVLHGVPTLWHLLMREATFSASRVASLRTGVIAGSDVAEELVGRVRRWCDVLVAYGLTETGPTVTMTRFTDSDERRHASVGRALEGVEVMAVDVVTGVLHGPEAVGEIAVRGPFLMRGYLRMPAETAKVHTPEGFFLTGDLGIIDEDGYVRIVGRRRETIARGGYQVYPREVEDRLRAHPAVDDVCVIGIPHEVLGEQVCACIVPLEGAVITGRDITLFARDVMAEYKVPDLVRFYDAFPMSGSGKIRRRELARSIALDLSASYT